jgi:hypothetical protein
LVEEKAKQDLEEYTVPMPGETANPEAEAKAERR